VIDPTADDLSATPASAGTLAQLRYDRSLEEEGPDMRDEALHEWLSRIPPAERAARDEGIDAQDVTPRPADVWSRHLDDDVALGLVREYEGRSITRRDLVDHAAEALTSDSDVAWIRAFMACQLWGVGTTGRVHHTATTLRSADTPAAFRDLARCVKDGEAHRAAGRWAPSWNRSFTTKFAYAVARALDGERPRALIYDMRVGKQLRRIGYGFPELTGPTHKPWRRYGGYIEALQASADELGCRPDTIEWLLFEPPWQGPGTTS
jgi:hypothetical protein